MNRSGVRRAAAASLAALLLAGCSSAGDGSGRSSPSSAQVSVEPVTPPPTAIVSTPVPADGRPLQSIPDVRPAGFADPPPGVGLGRYAAQRLSWQPCRRTLQCATVLVPLDYARPDGPAITLGLAKRPATAAQRLGTLFINPGGPGGSGMDYVGYFDADGLAAYDVVGWDPRGVGESTPVACASGSEFDHYLTMDTSPDDAAELTARIDAERAFGRSCLAHSGPLLEHISTVETVRDLDLLRRLLGEARLDYVGSSYGTRIGALYAQLYPATVGRMVLDGAVNIATPAPLTQTEGFERALDHFAQWCVGQNCPLGASQADVLDTTKNLLDRLDAAPLAVGSRTLTQQLGVEAVFYSMYGGLASWPTLRDAVVQAAHGDGSGLLRLADVSDRRIAAGRYGQDMFAFPAIRCLDSQDTSVRQAEARYAELARKAPVLGRLGGADLTCPLWPVAPAAKQPTITAAGAPPIVVIGTTGDPATPYEYAVRMAATLPRSVLVTWRGEGHLAYGKSDCVDRVVVDYLAADVVPAEPVTC